MHRYIMDEIKQLYTTYLKEELGLRDDTIKHYTYYFNKFEGYTLTTQDVKKFLIHKCRNNNVARGFLKNYINFIKENIDKFSGVTLNDLNSIQLPRAKKVRRKLPVWIKEWEMEKIARILPYYRDQALLKLSFYTGLRLNEIMNICTNDFSWEEWNNHPEKPGILKIRSKIAKGGKERLVYVPPKVMELIKDYITKETVHRYISDASKQIFPISKRRWQAIIEKYSRIALGRSISPHKLRHSFATEVCLKNGLRIETIQKLLGHANISTTQIYSHVDQQKVQEEFQKIC